MKVASLSLLVSCALWLAGPSTARAGWLSGGDDCAPGTRWARGEYAAELRNARRLASMNCCGLKSYAESYRTSLNERLRATYYRPVAELPPQPGPPPQSIPLPPTLVESMEGSSPLPAGETTEPAKP